MRTFRIEAETGGTLGFEIEHVYVAPRTVARILEGIDGVVAESGEARWTLETAKELNIPMPSIQASFDVRLASQNGNTNFSTKLLAAMRNKFGGHKLN